MKFRNATALITVLTVLTGCEKFTPKHESLSYADVTDAYYLGYRKLDPGETA